MGSSEKFCLRWNDFETNISSAFREIREDEEFFDVTLACDEQQVKAHKVILSACSPFFRTVLKKNPHQHPLLYMKGVRYQDLEAVLNFMYHGEVNVSQDDLNSFLAVAEDLRVKGLTQNKDNDVKPKSEPSVPKLSHRKTPDRPDSGPPTKRPRNSIAPSSQASQSSSNQSAPVEEDDIQDITPATVKSEPNQPMIVQPDVHYDEGQMGDESFGAEDDNFDYGQYESESGDMSYGADGQMVGVAGPSSADGSKERSSPSFPFHSTFGGLIDYINEEITRLLFRHPDKTFGCRVCGKSFKLKHHVQTHIENMHIETGGFKCPKCDKVLKSRNSLQMHFSSKHKGSPEGLARLFGRNLGYSLTEKQPVMFGHFKI